jgi:predicted phage baseplate assembly protein
MLRLIGYELRPPVAASADLTLLFKGDATGDVVIRTGHEFQTTKETTGTPVKFRFTRPDVTIARGKLPLYILTATGELAPASADTPPAKAYRLYRTLPLVQVDAAVEREIVGSSDGSAGQRFKLQRAPLIENTLRLTIDEGTHVEWTRVTSLLASQGSDRHFVVRRDEHGDAWIELGDGIHGKPPRRGRNNITASYMVGGGARGNLPKRTIAKAVVPIDGLKSLLNEGAASGGADAEPTAEGVARGPQQHRSMGRAVTKDDYEAHARSLGVAKVRAYAPGWNLINLVVAPSGGGMPTDTLKRDLRAHFAEKRMITSQVEITDPIYVGVVIVGQVTVDHRYFNAQVQQSVDEKLRALWSFDNVSFADTLYLSKIYEAVEAIDGVEAAVISVFSRNEYDEGIPGDGTLRFAFNEIPYIKALTLPASGGRSDV